MSKKIILVIIGVLVIFSCKHNISNKVQITFDEITTSASQPLTFETIDSIFIILFSFNDIFNPFIFLTLSFLEITITMKAMTKNTNIISIPIISIKRVVCFMSLL